MSSPPPGRPRHATLIAALVTLVAAVTALWPLHAQIDLINLSSGITGTLPIGNGGTGQITATAAFDALAPTTTRGDLIYRGAANNVRLAKCTATQLLTWGANDPACASNIYQHQWQFIAGAAAATWNPADATAYYLILNDGSLVGNPGTAVPSVSTSAFYAHTPVPMTVTQIYVDMLCSGASSSETATIDIRVDNTTNTQILTGITCTNNLGSGLANNFSATGLSVALTTNDWFVLKFTTPTWVTNPTGAFLVISVVGTGP